MRPDDLLADIDFTNDLLTKLKNISGCDSIHFEMSTKFAAKQDAYRQLLRQAIDIKLRELCKNEALTASLSEPFESTNLCLSAVDQLDLFNLDNYPRASFVDISISHCKMAGGFVLSGCGWQIGLDIEEPHRISNEIINRVVTSSELKEAPTRSDLWVAKESVFKSLKGTTQPKTITELNITEWSQSGNGISSFSFSVGNLKTKNGVGVSRQVGPLIVGISLLKIG